MPRRPLGFDFTGAVRRVCVDMASRLPELHHVAMEYVAVGVRRARHRLGHGLYAALTPLRFAGGRRCEVFRGRRRCIQSLAAPDGEECLYLLNFYLPRFLDMRLEDKLATIVHELWHIGPSFDGDLRRHDGRCFAHGPSRRVYDAEMDRLAQRWLAADPPGHVYGFLAQSYDELCAEYGAVVGDRWPTPRLVPA